MEQGVLQMVALITPTNAFNITIVAITPIPKATLATTTVSVSLTVFQPHPGHPSHLHDPHQRGLWVEKKWKVEVFWFGSHHLYHFCSCLCTTPHSCPIYTAPVLLRLGPGIAKGAL